MTTRDDIEDADGLDLSKVPLSHDQASELGDKIREQPSAEKQISRHISRIGEIDVRKALERLTIADMMNAIVSSTPIRDDLIGLPPALHDYLIGLLLYYADSDGKRDLSYQELAGPILDASLRYQMSERFVPSPTAPDHLKNKADVEHAMIQQRFITGEFMMSKQPIIAARRAYEPHNEQLVSLHGFDINDAIDSERYIAGLLKVCRDWLQDKDEFDIREVPAGGDSLDSLVQQIASGQSLSIGSDSDDFRRDADAIESFYQKMGHYRQGLSLSKKMMYGQLDGNVSESEFTNFLNRMSIEVGSVNRELPEFKFPFQFNPLHKYPIIKHSERYFIPQSNAIRRALRESFYYDLCNMPGYGDPSGNSCGEFGNRFGDYLEEWVRDCLLKTYSEDRVLLNPEYPNGEEACDVLLLGNDALFAIECKTGKLPLRIREGDFDEIQSAVQKKVGKGYEEQSLKLVRKLRDENLDHLICDGERIKIREYKKYQPVVVVGEPYDSIATHLIDEILEIDDIPPYVVDIFDLQLITECLDDSWELENYVFSRIDLFRQNKIISPDEIDYLGTFLENGGKFPKFPENNMMMPKDMTHIVNNKIGYKFGY